MNFVFLASLSSLISLSACVSIVTYEPRENVNLNNRPIIGVLTQEVSPTMQNKFSANGSYIAASYVKYLEGAGARVVPVWIGRNSSYYKNITSSVNGILFPGGATYFTEPDGYAAAGAFVYNYAVELNKKGIYFPLWGTCLGFELMTFLAAGQREHRCTCSANNMAAPVTFKQDFALSRLYGNIPNDILNILTNEPVAAHFHSYCVTEANMTAFGLIQDWHILSTGKDSNGLEFVSSIESRSYPFYAVIFHPEKNSYEWKSNKQIPHTHDAIEMMQYFASFFVDEARKNSNSFADEETESEALIYNYKPTYTGNKSAFEQIYFFKH